MNSNDSPKGILYTIAGFIGVALGLFSLYRVFPFMGMIPTLLARKTFYLGVVVMVYIMAYESEKTLWGKIVSALFLAAGVGSIVYLMWLWGKLPDRMGIPIAQDIPFCVTLVIVTLDITRRKIGWPLVIIASIFILYARFGDLVPMDLFKHTSYSWAETFFHLANGPKGVWALPLGVIVDFVFLFILFGSILLSTGAIEYIIKLACFLTKGFRSGPAMMAVIGSGFFGSISGSTLANAATTGNFTIPLMKKVGYPGKVAGGIEAAASIGGQWMPPIMGASAFIMAALLGIPYLEVVKNAAIPALLYFFAVGAMVVAMSSKYQLSPMPEEEYRQFLDISVVEWIVSSIQIVVPIVVLIWFLVVGYSPSMAAGNSILVLVVISLLCRNKGETVKERLLKIWRGFTKAGYAILTVAAACAAAGMILGVVVMTGAAVKFTALIVNVSGGSTLIALLLVMLASLFLGMGVPVTASYIIVATVAAPALAKLGVAALIAHLCSFWYAIDSEVTPPVCVTSYTTAAIAEANPWQTAIQGWKSAKGLYVIPILVVTSPVIPISWGDASTLSIVLAIVTAFAGLFALSVSLERFFMTKLNWVEVIVFGACSLLLFMPYLWADLTGLGVFLVLIAYCYLKRRLKGPNPAPSVSTSARSDRATD